MAGSGPTTTTGPISPSGDHRSSGSGSPPGLAGWSISMASWRPSCQLRRPDAITRRSRCRRRIGSASHRDVAGSPLAGEVVEVRCHGGLLELWHHRCADRHPRPTPRPRGEVRPPRPRSTALAVHGPRRSGCRWTASGFLMDAQLRRRLSYWAGRTVTPDVTSRSRSLQARSSSPSTVGSSPCTPPDTTPPRNTAPSPHLGVVPARSRSLTLHDVSRRCRSQSVARVPDLDMATDGHAVTNATTGAVEGCRRRIGSRCRTASPGASMRSRRSWPFGSPDGRACEPDGSLPSVARPLSPTRLERPKAPSVRSPDAARSHAKS